jgi:hypothetical protein
VTSTLKAYREAMFTLQADPDGFGRVENVTALAAQSVTAGSLAFGSVSSSKWQNKYLCRPDAALVGGVPVDRVRICSAFTSSSGTLTHAGTAYADTTITGEVVEISEYEPARLDGMVNRALGRLRFRDVSIIPTTGAQRYWLGAPGWINQPADVAAVYYVSRPVLTQNRYFQKWNIATPGTAAITAVPDGWTAYGSTATYQRVTSSTYMSGQNACSIVAPGGNVVGLSQAVGLLNDGISGDNLQNKIVTVVGVAQQSVSSKWRAWYSDDGGTTKQYTAFSTNTTYADELSLQVTTSATASNPTCGIEVVAGATVVASQCYLMLGALSDSVRKDQFTATEIEKAWDQSGGPNAMMLYANTAWALGGQLEVHSKRAYPSLTLDTDTADAPLVAIATDALYLLYRGLASTAGQDTTRYAQLAAYWRTQAATERAKHFYTNFGQYGAPWPPTMLTPFPVRVA